MYSLKKRAIHTEIGRFDQFNFGRNRVKEFATAKKGKHERKDFIIWTNFKVGPYGLL